MDPMHPYERLPLFVAGIWLAVWLIGFHAFLLAKPVLAQHGLRRFQRNSLTGQILLGIGLCWFWLLVAEPGPGLIRSLAMELGEFNSAKPILRIVVPAALIGVSFSVRDFLAVRALGLIGLLAAAPLLEAAFLKEPMSRLLVPTYAYLMLTASLFMVGMPYLFRDAVDWVAAKQARWTAFGASGLLYGLAVLICALAFWRGH